MKLKTILKIGAVALASTLLLTACSSKSSKKKVVLTTVGTTNPFSFVKDGKLTGYDIEVAKEVFKGSDKYKVEYKKTEWKSVFSGLDSGRFQIGANNISYTKERAKKYLYSNPTASNPMVLIVPKNSAIKSYDDIAGHSTQVVAGNTSEVLLKKFNAKKSGSDKVKINYTDEDLSKQIRNVSDGRYDFKIFEKISAQTIIKQQGLDNLKTIELSSAQKPYIYFIFSQDQKDLQKYVNKRIKKLYDNGKLEKLSQKYLGGSYLPNKKDIK
ncbi:amino acid ABC transporter substrate-binding protein [Streptococcus macacae]|uniref:ABC transporter, substrate-binding protein, family 3 n=1 Tax=Streptococcus macacae NCTC 11558 TaxID=764298 RepID=G5JV02_9STRE|nr:amino acid ABC transporter substrate-binding protein [Streptococcus macacae]EHJ51815.1 ABC transporter, substrate-binding protein, family 3 [Streptococcus macacae NCTC 11558]SUN79299.1 amino acid binding protein [Streptococcus macacae NCTC 11558]